MGAITLEGVEKCYGDLQVIKGIDLEIAQGEFVVFVGPPGCGKPTLLRKIGGLEEISRGSLLTIDGGTAGQVTVRTDADTALKEGHWVGPIAPPERLHFFGSDGLAI